MNGTEKCRRICELEYAYLNLEGAVKDIQGVSWAANEIFQENILKSEIKRNGPYRIFALTDEQVNGMACIMSLLVRVVNEMGDEYSESREKVQAAGTKGGEM